MINLSQALSANNQYVKWNFRILRFIFVSYCLINASITHGQIAVPDSSRPGAIRPEQFESTSLPQVLSQSNQQNDSIAPMQVAQVAVPDAIRPGAIRPEQQNRSTVPATPPEPEQII